MLYQDNGKSLSTKETIDMSKDCPKFFGLPVTCGRRRVEKRVYKVLIMKNVACDNLDKHASFLSFFGKNMIEFFLQTKKLSC